MVVHGAGRRVALVAPDLVEKLAPGREIATGPFRNLFEDPDGPRIRPSSPSGRSPAGAVAIGSARDEKDENRDLRSHGRRGPHVPAIVVGDATAPPAGAQLDGQQLGCVRHHHFI
jgi:hypothetical protein